MTFKYALTTPIQTWKEQLEESYEGSEFVPEYVTQSDYSVPAQAFLEAIEKLVWASETEIREWRRGSTGIYPVWCYSIEDSWVTYFEIRYSWLLPSIHRFYAYR